MPVRKPASWMQLIDDRILEYLQEEHTATPSSMASDEWIRGSEDEIQEHCERLCRAGLISLITEDSFILSPFGEGYIRGDLDLRDEEKGSGRIIAQSIDGELVGIPNYINCEMTYFLDGHILRLP